VGSETLEKYNAEYMTAEQRDERERSEFRRREAKRAAATQRYNNAADEEEWFDRHRKSIFEGLDEKKINARRQLKVCRKLRTVVCRNMARADNDLYEALTPIYELYVRTVDRPGPLLVAIEAYEEGSSNHSADSPLLHRLIKASIVRDGKNTVARLNGLKLASRDFRALSYAIFEDIAPEELPAFFKVQGGLHRCAAKYTAIKKERMRLQGNKGEEADDAYYTRDERAAVSNAETAPRSVIGTAKVGAFEQVTARLAKLPRKAVLVVLFRKDGDGRIRVRRTTTLPLAVRVVKRLTRPSSACT
jgi:hypothetical protein